MRKFILPILFAVYATNLHAQLTCIPSIYGSHIPIFPQASNEGLTTPILVSDKPEYAAYLQSQAFCEACLGGPTHPTIDCADFKFDTNITTDSISACLAEPNNHSFHTKKAISFALEDFDMVKRSYKKCVIRGREMDYEPCLFIFETACAKYVAETGDDHDCETMEDYYNQNGSTPSEDFLITHKANLNYMLKFYNCPTSDAYNSSCPTAIHNQTPPLTGDCAHDEENE